MAVQSRYYTLRKNEIGGKGDGPPVVSSFPAIQPRQLAVAKWFSANRRQIPAHVLNIVGCIVLSKLPHLPPKSCLKLPLHCALDVNGLT